MLYRAKTGVPWRDLPERFGPWKTTNNRFAEWSHRGFWAGLFEALQLEVDEDGVTIDATIVRAHQDAAGEKGDQQQRFGSFTWWILHEGPRARRHEGRPLHIALTPGRQHESTVAESIIKKHARGKAFVADTGYDSDALHNCVRQPGMKGVIHPNPTRRKKPRLDRKTYSKRYLTEVFFHHLKRFRCLATRFEKTAKHYLVPIRKRRCEFSAASVDPLELSFFVLRGFF